MSNEDQTEVEMNPISSLKVITTENKCDRSLENTEQASDVTVQPSSDSTSQYKASPILVYIHIAFSAMCGCLSRIGTDYLFGNVVKIENSGEVVDHSFISNIAGCFILGALHGSVMKETKFVALYVGLTTGYCGSFTTWSKWNQQISLTLIGETQTPSQTQVLSITSWFVGFYAFTGSYCVGIDFGKDVGSKLDKHVSLHRPRLGEIIVSVLFVCAVLGVSLGIIYDPTHFGKSIWFAILFTPFGACLRAWLSRFNKNRFQLPFGTLAANVLGSVILAGVHVLNTRLVFKTCNSPAICWPKIVTYGLGTGFCACLTTISTFIGELHHLKLTHPRYAYGYVVSTIVICQLLCAVINGVNFYV